MDVLQTLVRSSPRPLSEALIHQSFPAAVQSTLHTDDAATMQNGGECLRAYVSVALEQICQWQDGQGTCKTCNVNLYQSYLADHYMYMYIQFGLFNVRRFFGQYHLTLERAKQGFIGISSGHQHPFLTFSN